jgi:competence protein ComEA
MADLLERGRAEPWRLAAVVAGVGTLIFATWWLLRPPEVDLAEVIPLAGAAETAGGASAPSRNVTSTSAGGPPSPDPGIPVGTEASPALITVHVAGAVQRPGVYRTQPGARVADAVTVAGGSTGGAALDRLNLAAPLRDGMRVYVPEVGEVVPEVELPHGGVGETSADPVIAVSLNEAGVADFERLPGVGPTIAAAIVDHRDRNGPFSALDELLNVTGIGPAKFGAIEGLIRL